jgi:hypothetical protein
MKQQICLPAIFSREKLLWHLSFFSLANGIFLDPERRTINLYMYLFPMQKVQNYASNVNGKKGVDLAIN